MPYYANELDTSVLMPPVSAPNAKLNNSISEVVVAAVVGGGSVVNGMGYNRGSKADYDGWEALGNPGWGWKGLLPYFRKSTTFAPPTASAAAQWNITWDSSVYGSGPLRTHIPSFNIPTSLRSGTHSDTKQALRPPWEPIRGLEPARSGRHQPLMLET